MNLILTRTETNEDGVFGRLSDENDNLIAVTLEHAYRYIDGTTGYFAKLSPDTYRCVRGEHRLAHMTHSFTTFEITGVPGHTNILFHTGNVNADSDGCVLLGMSLGIVGNVTGIVASRDTFDKFMKIQENVSEFTLAVRNS